MFLENRQHAVFEVKMWRKLPQASGLSSKTARPMSLPRLWHTKKFHTLIYVKLTALEGVAATQEEREGRGIRPWPGISKRRGQGPGRMCMPEPSAEWEKGYQYSG